MLRIRLAELMISSYLLPLLVLKGVLAKPSPNPKPECNQPIPAILWKSGSDYRPGSTLIHYNTDFLTNSDVIDIAREKRKDGDILVILDAKV